MKNDRLYYIDVVKFSFQGRREKNEDSIKEGSRGNDLFFIVCDGVGGEKYGEIASRLACEAYSVFFEKKGAAEIDEPFFAGATDFVERSFDRYFTKYPDRSGMATTVALLFFDKDKAWSIHAGDSRIYHIRDGNILFKSRDHSVVNELLDNDLITAEEAELSAQKHIITRAIQGKKIKPTRTTVNLLSPISENDYFFICTDGVTEGVSDQQLVKILSASESNNNKAAIIKQLCEERSLDNYSGYLLQLNKI